MEKALKMKVSLTAEKLRDIVLEDKALCYKTQGQTIVFENDIYCTHSQPVLSNILK